MTSRLTRGPGWPAQPCLIPERGRTHRSLSDPGATVCRVSAVTGTGTSPAELLRAACGGDSRAFQALVAPHLRALHLHSYRMLGSYTEAEDAVRDTMLRAWQGLAGFEGRAPLRHWQYRISTTTCLKMIRDRRRDPATTADVAWLQPYPDALLSQLDGTGADPAGIAEGRESVALAFIAALQLLPASQRAVLILRNVLAWPARDVADLLDTSVAAVNSALQRVPRLRHHGPDRRPWPDRHHYRLPRPRLVLDLRPAPHPPLTTAARPPATGTRTANACSASPAPPPGSPGWPIPKPAPNTCRRHSGLGRRPCGPQVSSSGFIPMARVRPERPSRRGVR